MSVAHLQPRCDGRQRSRILLAFLVCLGVSPTLVRAEPALPIVVTEQHFEALLLRSPFTRPLNLSDTLVLTGVAEVDGRPVATLLDTEDGRSLAISELPNERGWRVVELRRPDDLDLAVATISVEGGDVIHVRHDLERVKSTAQRLKYKAQARAQMAAAEARARHHSGAGPAHGVPADRVAMLKKIGQSELPKGYNPGAGRNREESHQLHQDYVDQRMAGMTDRQRGRVGQLWKEQQAVDPNMSNRGASFVRIMEHVAENEPR